MMDMSNWPHLKDQLKYMIDVHPELLDKLNGKGVLTEEQFDKFYEEPNYMNRTVQILENFALLTGEQQSKFFEALDETHQEHISRYIRANGLRPDVDANNWPLNGTTEWRKIRANWGDLIKFTDSYYGLLDELVSAKSITFQHKKTISSHQEQNERNEKLFAILRQRSVKDYNNFIDCLLKTNQSHVASLLGSDKAGNVSPLAATYEIRLQENYSSLIDNVELEHSGLLDQLYALKCLTLRQRNAVAETNLDRPKRVELLLEILLRGSQPNFVVFIGCLKEVGQTHLCELLESDVIAAEIDVCVDDETGNTEQTEKLIVERIANMLICHSKDETDRVLSKVRNQLESHDVKLFAAQPHRSIRLYFICRSLAGVQYLQDVFTTGELQNTVQQLFRSLLKDAVNIVVDRLKWKEPNYTKCSNHFKAATSVNFTFDTVKRITMDEKDTISVKPHDDMFDDITTCPYCTECFSDPRTLPCLHTFCLKCITEFCVNKLPGDGANCPLCRTEFGIPTNGIEALPKNFFIAKLMSMKDEVPNVRTTYLPTTCGDLHPTKELDFYCQDCREALCVMCFITKHKEHRVDDIAEIADERRQEINSSVAELETSIHASAGRLKKMQINHQKITETSSEAVAQIRARADELHAIIERHKVQLLSEFNVLSCGQLKGIDTSINDLTRTKVLVDNFMKYSEEVLKKGSDSDIARKAHDIKQTSIKLKLLCDKDHDELSPYNVTPFSFIPSESRFTDVRNVFGKISTLSDTAAAVQDDARSAAEISTSSTSSSVASTPRPRQQRMIDEQMETVPQVRSIEDWIYDLEQRLPECDKNRPTTWRIDRNDDAFLETLCEKYKKADNIELLRKLEVEFDGESDVDKGALTRQLFYTAFEATSSDKLQYKDIRLMAGEKGHLLPETTAEHFVDAYEFIGKMIAHAVRNRCRGFLGLAPAVQAYIVYGKDVERHLQNLMPVLLDDVHDQDLKTVLRKLFTSDDLTTQDEDELQNWMKKCNCRSQLTDRTRVLIAQDLLLYYVWGRQIRQIDALAKGMELFDLRQFLRLNATKENLAIVFPSPNDIIITPNLFKGIVVYRGEHFDLATWHFLDRFLQELSDNKIGNCNISNLVEFFTGVPYLPPKIVISFSDSDVVSVGRTCDYELQLPTKHSNYESFREKMLLCITHKEQAEPR